MAIQPMTIEIIELLHNTINESAALNQALQHAAETVAQKDVEIARLTNLLALKDAAPTPIRAVDADMHKDEEVS